MHQALQTADVEIRQKKFLAIEVNGRGFGVPIESVKEIVYHTRLNPLPQTPEFVRGVALIRNETIPVLDMNILLSGDTQTPIHHESCFIVIQVVDSEEKLTQICLLADRILQTYKIDTNAVDKPPVINDKAILNYVLGVARVEQNIFVLLDLARLITPFLETVTPYAANAANVDEPETNDLSEEPGTHTNKISNNKYLSVFINKEEFAFPLSVVSQVINKADVKDYIEGDIPEFLYGAAIFNGGPLAIVCLSDLISRDNAENDESKGESGTVEAPAEEKVREVLVLVEHTDCLLGIAVDRIGKTYENQVALKENSFCNDLERKRVKSLGFIDKEEGSIEVIDPVGLLTDKENELINSWMRCSARILMTTDTQGTEATALKDEAASNPLAKFSGSYLVVQAGNVLIGLNNSVVDEVLSYEELISFKSGPGWFSGLLDLRQSTYPVIDLHSKLDIDAPANKQDGRNVLVMIKHKEQKIGLLIDEIIQSTHITVDQIQGPEESKLLIVPDALDAIGSIDCGYVHILNLRHVIEADEISARRLMDELREQPEEEVLEVSSI